MTSAKILTPDPTPPPVTVTNQLTVPFVCFLIVEHPLWTSFMEAPIWKC